MAYTNGHPGRAGGGGGGCSTPQKPFHRASSAGRLRPMPSPSQSTCSLAGDSRFVGRTVFYPTPRADLAPSLECSFVTTNISKINEDRHNSQRINTFRTPSMSREASHSADTFRQDLLDAVRAELQGGLKGIRKDMLQGCQDALSMAKEEIKEEMLTLRGNLDADFSQVLGEIWKLHPSGSDISGDKENRPLRDTFGAVQASKREADLGHILEELRRLSGEIALGLAAIKENTTKGKLVERQAQADLGHTLEELRRLSGEIALGLAANKENTTKGKLVEWQVVVDELRRVGTGALQPVVEALAAIKNSRHQVDLQPILQEVRNFKPLLERSKAEVDFSEVLAAIERTRSQAELQPLLTEVRRALTRFEGAANKARTAAPEEPIKAGNDVSPILKVIEECRAKLNTMQPLLEEIRGIKAEVCITPAVMQPILEEIHRIKADENSLPLLEEIRRVKTEVDLSPVLVAIKENAGTGSNFPLDVQAVVEEIRSIKREVDFSPVLNAIKDSKVDVDHRSFVEEIRRIKTEIDFSPVLLAIRESCGNARADNQETRDAQPFVEEQAAEKAKAEALAKNTEHDNVAVKAEAEAAAESARAAEASSGTVELLEEEENDEEHAAEKALSEAPAENTERESVAVKAEAEAAAESARAEEVYYLPKSVNGHPVLIPEGPNSWRSDKTLLKSPGPGLGYRNSPDEKDKAGKKAFLKWGELTQGVDMQNNWIKISVRTQDVKQEAQAAPPAPAVSTPGSTPAAAPPAPAASTPGSTPAVAPAAVMPVSGLNATTKLEQGPQRLLPQASGPSAPLEEVPAEEESSVTNLASTAGALRGYSDFEDMDIEEDWETEST